ncbi:mechanosensitive ion channel family protein [Lignipirellula cremea]|uniref:Small-conductance mechanosensitive channel n=1 Tax=Lignipirellula cremea TaxID=2528010 RepID=A0A518DTW2_9BACT|nr:mechanosensitive ion channel family protein [Lignipirellula cremea]QDU95280.1 Small-conductance mechanosensitive channel [Lignipirellula cremea]
MFKDLNLPPDIKDMLEKYVVDYGLKAAGALLLLFLAWIGAQFLSRLVSSGLAKARVDETLRKFFTRLTYWLVILMAAVSVLSMFGVETTSMAAVIGAGGLAVGLAFQGSLSNFAAGVMLLVFRPYKVGDVVTISGQTGKVDEIELFTTTLDTFDNRRFIVPNGSIFGSTIENVSHHPTRRVDVNVGVAYSAGIDQTREVLERAAISVEGVFIDPAPAVLLLDLGASSVDWSVRVWCDAAVLGQVKQDLIRAVKNSLDEADIDIPFPQMQLHLSPNAPPAPPRTEPKDPAAG